MEFEPAQALLSFNRSAVSGFERRDLREKRFILETVGSNLALTDRQLSIEVKEPFRRWTGTAQFNDWRGSLEDVRTFARA